MILNSRTPTLLVVGLIVIIIILLYNYWNLLEHNNVLRDRLLSNEDKLSDLNEKKSLLEKQGSKALEQIKEFEDKIEKNSQALSKKDSEIDELNTKLSSKDQEYSDLTPILPPGVEKLSDIVYGSLTIKLGKIEWIKNSYQTDHSLVKVKFWGDNGTGQLLKPTNSSQEFKLTPSEIKYDVKCSVVHFSKYLEDLGKLNISILDARNHKPVGCVILNLLMYLKKK